MTTGDDMRTAERAVLGAMIRANATIDEVVLLVAAQNFCQDAHQRIFAAAADLHGRGVPVDVVTLADELHRRGEVKDVGYPYLGELLDAAPTAANAPYYAQLIRERSVFRDLAFAAERIGTATKPPTGTAAEALEMAEREIFALAEAFVTRDVADAPQVVNEFYDHIDACTQRRGNAGGLPTGFLDLDQKTGGLQPASLTLIAARPGVGKTSLGAAIALNLALGKHPVLFASLEQTRREVMERLMCSLARVDSHALRKGLLGGEESDLLWKAGQQIGACPLTIDDSSQQSVLHVAANARRLKRRKGLAAIFVDYLQLLDPSERRAKRYEEVGDISRRLKAMAKDLGVPVVGMAQLNRESDSGAGREPRLSDLRESGSLEMDADAVLLLHRPNEPDGIIEVNIAKQRNGPTGKVRLTFLKQYTRFENYAAGFPPS
jgi:replicative DNA helicase